jgi:hypothetical protein
LFGCFFVYSSFSLTNYLIFEYFNFDNLGALPDLLTRYTPSEYTPTRENPSIPSTPSTPSTPKQPEPEDPYLIAFGLIIVGGVVVAAVYFDIIAIKNPENHWFWARDLVDWIKRKTFG